MQLVKLRIEIRGQLVAMMSSLAVDLNSPMGFPKGLFLFSHSIPMLLAMFMVLAREELCRFCPEMTLAASIEGVGMTFGACSSQAVANEYA